MVRKALHSALNWLGLDIVRAAGLTDSRRRLLQLEGCQTALENAKNEVALLRTQLEEAHRKKSVLEETRLAEPRVTRRIGDDPGLVERIRAEVHARRLPDRVARILLDPGFSIEDRARQAQLMQACWSQLQHWHDVGGVLALIVESQYHSYEPRSGNAQQVRACADTLRREGLVRLPTMLTADQIAEIQDYLLRRPVFNGHVPHGSRHRSLRRYVGHAAEDFSFGSYPVGDIVLAPHLLETVFHPLLLDIGANWLGCTPTLNWLQVWWNFPQRDYMLGEHISPKYFHRDLNDFRMYWVNIYLTDVTAESGPHAVIRRTADPEIIRERLALARRDPVLSKLAASLRREDFFDGYTYQIAPAVKEQMFEDLTETLTGPAGSVFLTRGFELHRVCAPILRKRCILAARFCVNGFADLSPERDGDRIPADILPPSFGLDAQFRHITRCCFEHGPPRAA